MKTSLRLLAFTLALALPIKAQQPVPLRLTIPASPPPGVQREAFLGSSVAVAGGYAVAGAPDDDAGAQDSGVVKVFDSRTGALLFVLRNPNPAYSAKFGAAVALSGALLVVGTYNDSTGAVAAGSAFVYDLGSATPTRPVFTLNHPSPSAYGRFGYAVAISGARVAVGAYGDDAGATDSGSAYVYDLGSAAPTVPVLILHNPEPAAGDYFGSGISISGSRLVVAATGDDTGASSAGSVYAYDLGSAVPAVPIAKLPNPHPVANDSFGNAVKISGTRVVVGNIWDDTGATNAGSAYVFDLAASTPAVPVLVLPNPNPSESDYFGGAVAISGARVVVGAYLNDAGALNDGSAYVYDLDSAAPAVPVVILNNPGPGRGDLFGLSVAISGARVAVGVPYDDAGATDAGGAYVYEMDSATPTVPVATLPNPDSESGDFFGISVAISGSLMVVGSPYDDAGGGRSGSAHVFDLNSSTPAVPIFTLRKPGPAAGDYFGVAVAISGTRVVVGALGDDTGATDAGGAYIYELSSATPAVPAFTLHKPGPAVNDDRFGTAVAVDGTRVVVGVPFDKTGAEKAGSAYVYDLASSTPTVPVVTLNNPGPQSYEYFGTAVTIAGTRVVVSAPYDNTGAGQTGSVYVYDIGSAAPAVPVFALNNPGPGFNDSFGNAVAMSGARVAVGAAYDGAVAIEGGSVYIYDLGSGTPLVPVVRLNKPSPADFENFGRSVSISGTRIVVGAPYDDPGEAAAGSAYVFDLRSSTPAVPVATLRKPGPALNDNFGTSVVIVGNTVAIGTPKGDSPQAVTGYVYLFDTLPGIAILTGPNARTDSTSAIFTFAGIDGATPPGAFTFEISLDGAPFTPAISPLVFSDLAAGPHTLAVRAIDAAGNVSATPTVFAWTIIVSRPIHDARYTEGRAVPGAGGGGIPADAVWTGFGEPAINDAGAIAFLGKWKSASGAGAGIFVNDTLIARKGGAERFESFKDPVLDAAGHVAFLARIDGAKRDEDSVLATNAFGALEIVAREGAATAEPGAPMLDRIESISLVDGEILFTARLEGGTPKVTDANNAAAFRIWNGGSTQHVVREGDALGATTVRSFKLLTAVPGSPGQKRAHAAGVATFLALLADGTQAVVENARGSLYIRESEFQHYGAIATAASNLAFVATRDGGVKSIFLGDAEYIDPVAQIGQATGVGATKFAGFQDPVLAPGTNQVAFPATLRGTTRAQDETLWWQPRTGPLTLLAREGAQPPEVPAGAKWDDFKSLAFPGGSGEADSLRGPIFLATMQRGAGGMHQRNDEGVWAVDSEGALRLLFREGGTVAGGIAKTIAVLHAVPGSPGVTRAFNNEAQVAWRATFTDGTSAIVVTQVP